MENNIPQKLLHNGEAFFSVALIGFPGSGKTTVGKQLAKALHYQFFDMDIQFAEKYDISVNQFFQEFGETMFRKCEYELLQEAIQQPYTVISCGGGTPCFFNTMDLLLQNCYTIYIKMAAKSLHQRLLHSKRIRPLTENLSEEDLMTYINQTLPHREQFYNRAHLTYKGENFQIEELIQKLPIEK